MTTAFGSTPRHDRSPLPETALQNLIPSDKSPAVLGQKLRNAPDEIALEFVIVSRANLLAQALNFRILLPLRLQRLITANVDKRPREKIQHFAKDILEKLNRRLFRMINILADGPTFRTSTFFSVQPNSG